MFGIGEGVVRCSRLLVDIFSHACGEKVDVVKGVDEREWRSFASGRSELALQKCDDIPVKSGKGKQVHLIALTVVFYLLRPEVAVGLWQPPLQALISVPKAVLYADNCVVLAQYNVRSFR